MNIQTKNITSKEMDLSEFKMDFPFHESYGNFIGGEFKAPLSGKYFDNLSPIDGSHICRIARSDENDINAALDAAYAAQPAWAKKTATERAAVLLKIADRIETNLVKLAVAETIDNGKAIRESLGGDIPGAADHFRYFASCIRAEEGTLSHLDDDTYAYHVKEPLGVVGQIIPWNFPILMAVWKIAPAIAAGNTVVLKPAEQTPASIMVLMDLISDILPAGVINIVNGYGLEAGKPLASSSRIAKIAFTGETGTGRMIMGYASQNLIPVTLELGGKSPNVFFEDIMDADDGLFDKAIEGFVSFALNQGEVCTCPSRALIQESIYDKFMERALKRVAAIKRGHALKSDTMIGAQVSREQADRIEDYIKIGKDEGAELLAGGGNSVPSKELQGGFYVEPTVFKGNNKMRIFQEEIFGPVLAVATFKDEAEALEIANDTPYGLGAAVWTRDTNRAHRMSHGLQAGRVWVNSYHLYPVHAAFGGYKKSGIGRETHKMVLDHYQQTKSIVVSHSEKPMGLF